MRGIAEGEARDPRRGREIAIEQRRDNGERVGVRVETVGLLVGRKHGRAVDLDANQIADGIRIFSAIQTMKVGRPARIRVGLCGAIQFRFQPGGRSVVAGAVRPLASRRRHRAAAKLHDDLLPRLRRVEHVLRIGLVEHQTGRLELLVMTGDAIPRDELARRRRGDSGVGPP